MFWKANLGSGSGGLSNDRQPNGYLLQVVDILIVLLHTGGPTGCSTWRSTTLRHRISRLAAGGTRALEERTRGATSSSRTSTVAMSQCFVHSVRVSAHSRLF